MKIYIHKDWDYPNIFRQTPNSSGIWEDIKFTTQFRLSCDLVVVLNRPVRPLFGRVQKGGLWLFSQESPIDMYQWHTRSFKHFDRVFSYWDTAVSSNIIHTQTALPWHINKSYDELKSISHKIECTSKHDAISWVTSNASSKLGHKNRLAFMEYLHKVNFAFDLFGRGFKEIADKYEAIQPYKYSIAIENYNCNDYWTEKIADCFLSRTMPIYSGAKNITDYFPAESMIIIDPQQPEQARRKILHALDSDAYSKNLEHIEHARSLVLDKYQFFPNIVALLKKYPIGFKKKSYYIPRNNAH